MFTRLPQAVLLASLALRTAAIDPRLVTQVTSDVPINGVSTTPDNRTFVLYARVDGSKGPTLVEYFTNGTTSAYPSAEWNNYTTGADVTTHFVRLNAQRLGPDGYLYLVDVGSPAFGEPVIAAGVKLIQVNVNTNAVSRIYPLGNVTYRDSLLDDVRFNGPLAYLTDAGVPGIIVLDRSSGAATRVLNDTVSTRGYFPASGEGRLVNSPTGGYLYVYADQLEVSPDGKYLYYQAVSGGMHRIETRYLNDTSLTDAQRERYAEPFALTPSTGGTAIDANGNIYNSDTDFQRILKITPNGTMSVFIEDPRLLWVDAMWIDGSNRLWLPAAQLNRGVPFNNGSNLVVKPLYVFTIDIGVGPSALDHA